MTFLIQKIQGGPTVPAIYTKSPSKSFKFSETHDFYVKDPRQLPADLPPPRPPNKTKGEAIDIAEYMLVDDKAIRVYTFLCSFENNVYF